MIRHFRLRDSLFLQRLIRRSVPLQLERDLTQPSAPFWAALGAPLPWHGSGAATYLHRSNKVESLPNGFIQAIKRLGRPEADVTRIAPEGVDDDLTAVVWERLLKHVAIEAGEHGIQRLYIYIDSSSSSYDLICNCGYAPYIRETIFWLKSIPTTPPHITTIGPVRHQREADSFALQRLTSRYTPSVVQKAEGLFTNDEEQSSLLPIRSWWPSDQGEGLVYEENGDIIAATHIFPGRAGHWLCLHGDPNAIDAMKLLLEHSLLLLSSYRNLPIYCPIRPYQSAFGPLLRTHNFEKGPEMTRFVKHTTSFVKRPVAVLNRESVEGSVPSLAPTDIHYQS